MELSESVALAYKPDSAEPEPNWGTKQHQSLGLTQTCRQIRAEYLPVYFENTAVEFLYWHFDEYLSAFVEPQIAQYGNKSVVGNVTLRQKDHDVQSPDCPIYDTSCYCDERTVDVFPVIRLFIEAQKFSARFSICTEPKSYYYTYKEEQESIDRIFNIQENPKWAAYLTTAVSHIWLIDDGAPYLGRGIIIKNAFAEPWMEKHLRRSASGDEWFKQAGFPEMVEEYFCTVPDEF